MIKGFAAGFGRRVRRIFRREEPHFDFARLAGEDSLPTRPTLSTLGSKRNRWVIIGVVVSILLHIALLRFVGFGGGGYPGSGGAPIPVQLVMETPEQRKEAEEKRKEEQKPKPEEKDKDKPKKKEEEPPPGRLASDSFGDTEAKGKEATASHDKAAGKPEPKPGEAAPDAAQAPKTEAKPEEARPTEAEQAKKERGLDEAPLPETQRKLAEGGNPAPPASTAPPRDDLAFKPTPKPKPTQVPVPVGGSRNPQLRFEPDHAEGLAAKYPGPDASRDEYIAYLKDLTLQNKDLLNAEAMQGRTGFIHLIVRLRSNGSVIWITDMADSTPYADISARAHRMIELAAPRFPPLPAYLAKGGSESFEVLLPFPER